MVIALLTLECHLPMAQSLKEKRMFGRSVKDRLGKFIHAVAEVAHQDLWQRAGIAVVTVAGSETLAQQELEAVSNAIEAAEPGLVTRSEVEIL